MNKNLRRSVVALVTAFACLALSTSPASATSPTHNAAVTGGTVVIVATTTQNIPLGTTTPGCDPSVIEISHDATNPDPDNTVEVTDFVSEGRFQISTSTSTYVAELTYISSTPGTLDVTTTTGAVTNVGLSVLADIYLATSTDCSHGTTRACRFNNVDLVFSGTVPLTSLPLATGSTANLSSTTDVLASSPPCISVFTNLNGGTVGVNNMTIVLTT